MALDISMQTFNGFLLTTPGRDVFGKFFQYLCRGFAGVFESSDPDLHKKFKSVFVRVMEARRTTRWLMSINTFLGFFKQASWNSKLLFRLNQSGMLWWQILDHVRWLQETKTISGDPKQMKRISFLGFVFASVIGIFNFYKHLGEEKDESKKKKIKLQLFKHCLSLICTLHISEMYKTHEAICGFTGATVALIDLHSKYPKKLIKTN